MSDGFQYGDIIFLGLIAVFVALRLRSMLGKNTGLDPRETWKQATREISGEKISAFAERMGRKPVTDEEIVPVQLQDNKPVADGLKAIRAADGNFSTTEFLSGAKLAFEWIVQAYTKGDKDKLRLLLGDEPFKHFADEIEASAQSGITHEATLVAILSADITEAQMRAGRAQITVQFTTEQIHVSRDKDKNVVGGDASAIERVIDVWTFERDTTSRDPNWRITAT